MLKVLGIIVGILGFLFLIFFHEGGHFLAAKMVGVSVNEFSIGMGPLLYQKEKNGTMYSFRAFPIGGYCALEGEEEKSENPNAFTNASLIKKLLILIAGPLNNLILGLIVLIGVYAVVAAGVTETQIPFTRVLQVAWADFLDIAGMIFSFLAGFFNGTSSVNDMSGVVGIVAAVSETAEVGLVNVFYLIGILSINLGVVNMLPFPALDGGRILFSIINAITGKRISEKVEAVINAIGMILLLALMVFLVFKDSITLIRG